MYYETRVVDGLLRMCQTKKLPNLPHFISIEGLLGGAYSKKIASFSEEEFVTNYYHVFIEELKQSADPAFTKWATWYENAYPLAIYKSAKSMVAWAASGKLFELLNQFPSKSYLYDDNDNINDLLPKFVNVDTRYVKGGHFLMQDNPTELYSAIATILKS